MGHFSNQQIDDCDAHTTDDDWYDRADADYAADEDTSLGPRVGAALTDRVATARASKSVRYNTQDNEYDMFLDGRYVGTRPTHAAAQEALDALAYEEARRS